TEPSAVQLTVVFQTPANQSTLKRLPKARGESRRCD
ncbi:MAG: hypothetical protein ACI9HK_001411, partial [Pirellulaceae bacterium]